MEKFCEYRQFYQETNSPKVMVYINDMIHQCNRMKIDGLKTTCSCGNLRSSNSILPQILKIDMEEPSL